MSSTSAASRRRGLGGRAEAAPNVAESAEVAKKARANSDFINQSNDTDFRMVEIDRIKKFYNYRDIPCSVDDFNAVDWPDVDVDVAEALDAFKIELPKHNWFESLGVVRKNAFLNYMCQLHLRTQSMIRDKQLSPIILEEVDGYFYLLSGEGRMLSAHYSRGAIPMLKASVYLRPLSQKEKIQIAYQANTQKDVSFHEKLISQRDIYRSLPEDEQAYSLNRLLKTGYIDYKRSDLAIAIKVFRLSDEEFDSLLDRIVEEELYFRAIDELLKKGLDSDLAREQQSQPESASTYVDKNEELKDDEEESKTLDTSSLEKPEVKAEKDRDHLLLEEAISEKFGFPATIKKSASGVSLTFKAFDLNGFDSLLSHLNIKLDN